MKTVLEYLEYSAAVRPPRCRCGGRRGHGHLSGIGGGGRKVGSAPDGTHRPAGARGDLFLEKRPSGPLGLLGDGVCWRVLCPPEPGPAPGPGAADSVGAPGKLRYHRPGPPGQGPGDFLPRGHFGCGGALAAPSSRPGWRRCVLRWWTPTRCTPISPLVPPASPKGGWW